jgi:hypothetical protein
MMPDQSLTDHLNESERRIAFILAHPAASDWLKDALRAAIRRDPVDVGNDVELLHHLLSYWTKALIDVLLDASTESSNRRC